MFILSIDMSSIVSRYRETCNVLKIVVLISIIGMLLELGFAYVSSSIIIYTDVLHWAVDTTLEVISMIMFYIISKVYKRIRWNIFALESFTILSISLMIFVLYLVLLINTIYSYTETSFEPTTLNPYLALVTSVGGILTFMIFIIERRAYQKLRTDILRIDYIHAIMDIAVAIVASLGIVLTAYTRSFVIELTIVLFVLFVAIQTLVNLVKEAIKSILGFEADPQLKLKLISKLSELNNENVRIGEVELRKMGTFYVVRINVYLDPRTTIREAHRLRRIINIMCREVLELIYHVDIIFYPRKRISRFKGIDKHYKQKQEDGAH